MVRVAGGGLSPPEKHENIPENNIILKPSRETQDLQSIYMHEYSNGLIGALTPDATKATVAGGSEARRKMLKTTGKSLQGLTAAAKRKDSNNNSPSGPMQLK